MAMPVDMEAGTAGMQMGPPRATLLKDANAAIRLGFVRKVYSLLSAQLVVTCLIAAPFQFLSPVQLQGQSWLLGLSVVATLVCVCAMVCCKDTARTYPMNYVLLLAFTVFEAVLVGFASASFTWQSVMLCAGMTAGTFLGLTVFAFKTKADFTGFGPMLFGAAMSLAGWGFVLCTLGAFGVPIQWGVMFYDLIGLLIFVVYTIYDTQMIIGGEHKAHQFSIDDYVFAALNIYLDIIQLFLRMLRLFGKRK